MKQWLLVALAGAASPALAQEPAVPVEAAGVSGDEVARVMSDFAEVRAGPGEAYVSRGRVYQGDRVEVQRRSDTGAWVEVVAGGGVTGWLRSKDIKIVPGEKPAGAAATDAGRDRRQTNYTYDENGRRRRLDGRAAGSGEGARTQTPEDVDLDDFGAATVVSSGGGGGASALSLRVSLGAGQMARQFSSNAPANSLLALVEARPLGFGAEVAVEYVPLWFLAVRGGFRDLRFAETRLQTPRYNGGAPFGLAVDRQEALLDVGGRYPFGDGFAGVYVGGRFARQAFQELQPVPLLLTTTTIGLGAGAEAGWRLGPVDVAARGGVVLPFVVDQAPADSGEPSALGFEAGAEVAWSFMPGLSVVGSGQFSRLTIDHSGPATQVDPAVTAAGGSTYTVAKTVDTVFGGGLGVRWQP
ncbi:MAG: SH3 domain-containing protein [bacterium]